jgi:hypothetical protein
MSCYADGTAAAIASCMNDALANGARAEVDELSLDRYGTFVSRYLFAVGGQVIVYAINGTADPLTQPYTHTITMCAGPIHVGTQCPFGDTLAVDGCP